MRPRDMGSGSGIAPRSGRPGGRFELGRAWGGHTLEKSMKRPGSEALFRRRPVWVGYNGVHVRCEVPGCDCVGCGICFSTRSVFTPGSDALHSLMHASYACSDDAGASGDLECIPNGREHAPWVARTPAAGHPAAKVNYTRSRNIKKPPKNRKIP